MFNMRWKVISLIESKHINLSHIIVNVLINISILKNHQDLSFLSNLIQNIPQNVLTQDSFTLVLESQVQKNLLDLVELS